MRKRGRYRTKLCAVQQDALNRGHAFLSVRTTLGQQDRRDRAKRRTFYIRY
jgi:hypothetical protein